MTNNEPQANMSIDDALSAIEWHLDAWSIRNRERDYQGRIDALRNASAFFDYAREFNYGSAEYTLERLEAKLVDCAYATPVMAMNESDWGLIAAIIGRS